MFIRLLFLIIGFPKNAAIAVKYAKGDTMKNINVMAEANDPVCKADSEYPHWLWSVQRDMELRKLARTHIIQFPNSTEALKQHLSTNPILKDMDIDKVKEALDGYLPKSYMELERRWRQAKKRVFQDGLGKVIGSVYDKPVAKDDHQQLLKRRSILTSRAILSPDAEAYLQAALPTRCEMRTARRMQMRQNNREALEIEESGIIKPKKRPRSPYNRRPKKASF